MNLIERLVREVLLTEEVFGAQAFVYHGSRTKPDVFIPVLLNDELQPGSAAGSMYGKGLYTVYDLSGTQTGAGRYGEYVYKLKVNLYGFIIFDSDVAQKVYGKPLAPAEQAKLLGLEDAAERLNKIPPFVTNGFTSELALPASKFLKSEVKGIVFTGANDGRVAVIYDPTVATPFAWKRFDDKEWTQVDRSQLKKSLSKSASGEWEPEKYSKSLKQFKEMFKLPPEERIFKGDVELTGEEINDFVIPEDLKIQGNLSIKDSPMIKLPNGLKISGNLYVTKSLLRLGENITVGDTLSTSETGIYTIPESTKFKNMYIDGARGFELPPNFRIDGNITLSNVFMKDSLPDGMSVGGNLKISSGNIESLPKNLSVGGDLDISFAKIKSIKAGLSVGGNFHATWLRSIKLPRNLTVGKDFRLLKSTLKELPPGLKVGGDLDIRNSKIASLPPDLEVGGMIRAMDSHIFSLKVVPENLKQKVSWV